MAQGKFPSVNEYMRKWSQALIDSLRKSAIEEMNENKSKATIQSFGDPALSTLVAGIRFAPVILGNKIEFQIIMPENWNWLETGRSAGKMPPEEPIVKWMIRRGFQIKELSKKRKSLFRKIGSKTIRKALRQYSREKKLKQMAFLVRRKIGKEGTRATHFYSNIVTPKLISDLKTVIKEQFHKDIIIELQTLTK